LTSPPPRVNIQLLAKATTPRQDRSKTMAYLNKIEIIHETSGKYLNYEFYSADKMTDEEIFEEFTANLSIVPDIEEVDAEECEACQNWTENYKRREDNGLMLCPACYHLED
jgi:formylmethanofuran dehydrogenase subunit E